MNNIKSLSKYKATKVVENENSGFWGIRGYIAFTKKELLEQIRTYKLLIFFAAFLMFGLMSPLLARLMPNILSSMDMGGIKLELPSPTVMDAYAQFFKNLTQMGILVLLLVFGGSLSGEFVKGTLLQILAKGLSRTAVLLAKYTAAVLLWTGGFLLSVIINYIYTVYLFDKGYLPNLSLSLFCLWLFGMFLISLIFLSSTIAPGAFGGLILTVIALAAMLMGTVFNSVAKFNPVTLASVNTELLNGTIDAKAVYVTIIITVILTICSLLLSIFLFKKKRM